MPNSRKQSIVNALKKKGFSKRAASKIAKATIRKSKDKKLEGHACSWKQSVPAQLSMARNATNATENLHKKAAINKSTMVGKIVVVKPSQSAAISPSGGQ